MSVPAWPPQQAGFVQAQQTRPSQQSVVLSNRQTGRETEEIMSFTFLLSLLLLAGFTFCAHMHACTSRPSTSAGKVHVLHSRVKHARAPCDKSYFSFSSCFCSNSSLAQHPTSSHPVHNFSLAVFQTSRSYCASRLRPYCTVLACRHTQRFYSRRGIHCASPASNHASFR